MTRLSVNLNKVALLRNSRNLGIPSVTRAARTVLKAGAHGLTVHPRPDGRHIRAGVILPRIRLIALGEPRSKGSVEKVLFWGVVIHTVWACKPSEIVQTIR